MNITSITASFKRTQSLPGYCNVATGITMTAEVPVDVDPGLITEALCDQVETDVNNWIDAKLEQAGQPALYSHEPRFDLLWWQQGRIAVIAPHGYDRKTLPGYWTLYPSHDDTTYSNHRLDRLLSIARTLNLGDLRDFSPDGPSALEDWVDAYLALSTTWSIVNIAAPISDADTTPSILGRVAIPGDIYADLIRDDSVHVTLSHHPGVVGFRDTIEKVADNLESPIVDKRDYLNTWIQERIEALKQEAAAGPF